MRESGAEGLDQKLYQFDTEHVNETYLHQMQQEKSMFQNIYQHMNHKEFPNREMSENDYKQLVNDIQTVYKKKTKKLKDDLHLLDDLRKQNQDKEDFQNIQNKINQSQMSTSMHQGMRKKSFQPSNQNSTCNSFLGGDFQNMTKSKFKMESIDEKSEYIQELQENIEQHNMDIEDETHIQEQLQYEIRNLQKSISQIKQNVQQAQNMNRAMNRDIDKSSQNIFLIHQENQKSVMQLNHVHFLNQEKKAIEKKIQQDQDMIEKQKENYQHQAEDLQKEEEILYQIQIDKIINFYKNKKKNQKIQIKSISNLKTNQDLEQIMLHRSYNC